MKSRDIINRNFSDAASLLQIFSHSGDMIQNIEIAANLMVNSIRNGGKIIACGNGGSLCDATHFAEELTGRFHLDRRPLPAIAINDPAYLTCVANDYKFEETFARFIDAMGSAGDTLLAITTSGNSPNVVLAANKAKAKKMNVVVLSGKKGEISSCCDVEIRTPESRFSDRIQEIHIKIIHTLVELIENEML